MESTPVMSIEWIILIDERLSKESSFDENDEEASCSRMCEETSSTWVFEALKEKIF